MHPDKVSGPDGFNPTFFQQYRSIFGRDVFNCCKEWLEVGSFAVNLRDMNVVLIMKKENACRIRDLHPIAFCNVLYKILTKVLANRLKSILLGLMSENQSAFIPGKNIINNVLVAFEVIHYMNSKKRGQEGEVALMLDISKAYDRVNWSNLQMRMQAMGFYKNGFHGLYFVSRLSLMNFVSTLLC